MSLSQSEKNTISNTAVHFAAAVFDDKLRNDLNPGRGWYQVYTFDVRHAIDENELVWSLDKNERLALVLIDISVSRERPLSREELENTERIFSFFAAHGKEMIVRPLYDREGKGPEREPELFSLVIKHIEQIGGLIKEYSDSVHAVQGLFVGSWGEMHSSKFLSAENMKALAAALSGALGESCFISVRTPLQRRILNDGGISPDKIAIFDDGLFGSETHLGTFGWNKAACGPLEAWVAEREMEYIDSSCRFVPNGGEAVSGGDFSDDEVISVLRRMHISYLNRIYDAQILDKWKNTRLPQYGVSMYDYIGMRLGYRFIVEEACTAENDEAVTVYIRLRNDGFACLFRKADIYLKMVNEYGKERIMPCVADLRWLASGESVLLSWSIGSCLAYGRSELFLVIRHENGEYIRTANAPESDFTFIGEISINILEE